MLDFSLRYCFTGKLELSTALHIGGGRFGISSTDSPVIRTPDGNPFIPGSSFKGAFRSAVEKISTAFPGIVSCGLLEGSPCIGARGPAQDEFNKRRRAEDWDERELLNQLNEQNRLCDTCRLFGSQFLASKIQFDDLYLDGDAAVLQIRDGVGIHRDSEKAVDRLKFDYEVVPAGYSFSFRARLEEPTPRDLALACAGFSEYASGFGQLGGLRSRGLGKCLLANLRILELDLRGADSTAQLRNYLLNRDPEKKMRAVPDTEKFLQAAIDAILERRAATGD